MKELNIVQMELILEQMKYYQSEHPKANILYDPEKNRIDITYPLPKDFF